MLLSEKEKKKGKISDNAQTINQKHTKKPTNPTNTKDTMGSTHTKMVGQMSQHLPSPHESWPNYA